MIKKIIFQKCNMGIQNNAGFGADFESDEKVPNKLTRKSCQRKNGVFDLC
jgi:hypothetical protein